MCSWIESPAIVDDLSSATDVADLSATDVADLSATDIANFRTVAGVAAVKSCNFLVALPVVLLIEVSPESRA